MNISRAASLVKALETNPESVWTRDACLCVGDALRDAAKNILELQDKVKGLQNNRPCLPPGVVFIDANGAQLELPFKEVK